MIIAIILLFIAIAMILLIQFQVVNDYKPQIIPYLEDYDIKVKDGYVIPAQRLSFKTGCKLERESIFKYPFFKRFK